MRIIAGVAKGRRLKTLRGYDIRPTPEKVRESLFNRLGDLRGRRFLDGFAGSGAVGIEALSRGASRVVFVESDRRARRCVEENLGRVGFSEEEGSIWTILPMALVRAVAYLEKEGEAFDLIFLDPPYRTEAGLVALKRLAGSPLLVGGGRLFWEHAVSEEIEIAEKTGWRVVDTRRFGDTKVTELAGSG
ncbi:MAG: 16S rRNA (guanine(966)-N(2))-methyltransferase RsmD [bacterium]|nr:16S rRNA (guanine(966)-N(2))-methyltransferase RsmD [bacterium]MCZ6700869.1 16S rRNA (guanine(966)-N(2))-methyltransferase RsmD [bacterium]